MILESLHIFLSFYIYKYIYILFCHSLIYLFTNGQSFCFFFFYDLNVLLLPFLASVPPSCRGGGGREGGRIWGRMQVVKVWLLLSINLLQQLADF